MFGVEKAYFEKLEDSKVFGPTFSNWNCSAEQSSVGTKFTLQEVSCNINQNSASQMHITSN